MLVDNRNTTGHAGFIGHDYAGFFSCSEKFRVRAPVSMLLLAVTTCFAVFDRGQHQSLAAS